MGSNLNLSGDQSDASSQIVLSCNNVGRLSGPFDQFVQDISNLHENPQTRAKMGQRGKKC